MARNKFSTRFGLIAGFAVLSALMTFGAAPQAAAQAPSSAEAVVHQDSSIDQSASAAPAEQPKKRSFFGKIWDSLMKFDIKIGGSLNAELFDGLKVGLGYRYEVEPSYKDGYHWRMDTGRLKGSLNLGELLGYDEPRIGLSATSGIDFTLVRPFKTSADADGASPFGYDFKKIIDPATAKTELVKWLPFTAERAIAGMAVGDLFSFKAELTILGEVASLPIDLHTFFRGELHYIISGLYQVHVVRLPADKVEVRLVAMRQTKEGGSFTAGLGAGHKIFGVRIIDRRIEKIFNIPDIFRIESDKKTSTLQMVQYRLDLKEKRVRDAYDGIAAKVFEFQSLKIADPRKTIGELTDKLISDISPFDNIYREELARGAKTFTVERSFKGKNDVEISDSSSFKFAPIIFNFRDGREYYENMLSISNADESLNHYRLHTYRRESKLSKFLSRYKETGIGMATLLFDSDSKKGFGDLRDISFSWNYRDKELSKREMDDVRLAVRQAVPESVYRMIDWTPFNQRREFKNVGFSYRTVIAPQALSRLAGLNGPQLNEMLNRYLISLPEIQADPQASFTPEEGAGMGYDPKSPYTMQQQQLITRFAESTWSISTKLAVVFNPHETPQNRSNAFAELRFNDLFGTVGPGFLISMLPASNLPNLVSFEVSMSADGNNKMKPFVYGTPPDRKIYEAAAYIQSVLSADDFESITQMMKAGEKP